MGLAYLIAKASGKLLKVNFNIPLVLVLSILPDIDIIFQFFLKSDIHRGPTHSIVVATLFLIPVFVLLRQKATPYFAALASHSLIGDFLIGGQIQLFWPLSTQEFGLHELGLPLITIDSSINIALELTIFAVATVIMFKTRDIRVFLRKSKLNLVLVIPIFTVLLPTFAAYPLYVPIPLVLPHLFYLVLFAIAVLIALENRFLV
jgi:membrane-bound metal-dependent hydrolase YbcI (DUF457 family)